MTTHVLELCRVHTVWFLHFVYWWCMAQAIHIPIRNLSRNHQRMTLVDLISFGVNISFAVYAYMLTFNPS